MRSSLAALLCLLALALASSGLEPTRVGAGPPSNGALASTDRAGSGALSGIAGDPRRSAAPTGSIALLGLGLAGLTIAGARKPRVLAEAVG